MYIYDESIQFKGSPVIWETDEHKTTARCTFCVLAKDILVDKDALVTYLKTLTDCTIKAEQITISLVNRKYSEVFDSPVVKREILRKSTAQGSWHLAASSAPDLGFFPQSKPVNSDPERSNSSPEMHVASIPLLDRVAMDPGRSTCYEGNMKRNNIIALSAYSERVLLISGDIKTFTKVVIHTDIYPLKEMQLRLMRILLDTVIQPAVDSLSPKLSRTIREFLSNALYNAVDIDLHTQPSAIEAKNHDLDTNAVATTRKPDYRLQRIYRERSFRVQEALGDLYFLIEPDAIPSDITTDEETANWLLALKDKLVPHQDEIEQLLNRLARITTCLGIMKERYDKLQVNKPTFSYAGLAKSMADERVKGTLLDYAIKQLDPLDQFIPHEHAHLGEYCSLFDHLSSSIAQLKKTKEFSPEEVIRLLKQKLVEATHGGVSDAQPLDLSNPYAPFLPKVKSIIEIADLYILLDWQLVLDAMLANAMNKPKKEKKFSNEDLATIIWTFIDSKVHQARANLTAVDVGVPVVDETNDELSPQL